MRSTTVAIITAITGLLLLGGCSAEVDAAAPAPSIDADAADALLCEQFGDVLTITNNTDFALHEERMAEQEHAGWQRLATRVLNRLDTDSAPTVGPIVDEIKTIAPNVRMGAISDVDGFTSDAWYEQQTALLTACDAVGEPLASEGFVGG